MDVYAKDIYQSPLVSFPLDTVGSLYFYLLCNRHQFQYSVQELHSFLIIVNYLSNHHYLGILQIQGMSLPKL